MRVVEEDLSTSFESPSELLGMLPQEPTTLKNPAPGLFMNLSCSSLDYRADSAAPGSPRSTLEHGADPEDGVIVTGKTRSEKMTKRHSMSRLFGVPTMNRSSSSESSGTASTTAASTPPTSTFEQVVQMVPGVLKRRGSLLNSRAKSHDDLSTYSPPPSTSSNVSTAATRKIPMQRQLRRNSVGSSSPSLIPTSTSSKGHSSSSSRRLLRRNSMGSSSNLLGKTSSGGGGRGLGNRTTSYRRQDSINNSQGSLSGSYHTSDPSRGGVKRERPNMMKRQASVAELMVDCNTTVSVSNTWASLRRVPDYEKRFGEQVIFKLMEMDPLATRVNLRLESFFSDRFTEICRVLCETVDMIVTLLGPDLDEAGPELARCGKACREQGIPTDRLGEAVSTSIDKLLGPEELTPDMVKAWKIVFDALRRRLS